MELSLSQNTSFTEYLPSLSNELSDACSQVQKNNSKLTLVELAECEVTLTGLNQELEGRCISALQLNQFTMSDQEVINLRKWAITKVNPENGYKLKNLVEKCDFFIFKVLLQRHFVEPIEKLREYLELLTTNDIYLKHVSLFIVPEVSVLPKLQLIKQLHPSVISITPEKFPSDS